MALYAFDGTNNKDEPIDKNDSNVVKFRNAYKARYSGPGNCFYVSGVGTRFGAAGKFLGSVFGAGGKKRLNEARKQLKRNFAVGDQTIDIIGFSRGAALALEFANDILDKGVAGIDSPPIRFLGIWDTVGSFGLPGNNVNLGYQLSVPHNVEACAHAIALDERRFTFPLTRVVQNAYSDREQKNIREVWFRGFHSDIGGGNGNLPLSSIALHWMYCRAKDNGVTLAEEAVQNAKALSDPSADGKTPKMDRKANRKRTILVTDLVHETVDRRRKCGKFEANNPPRGLAVVNDAGQLLGNGFELG